MDDRWKYSSTIKNMEKAIPLMRRYEAAYLHANGKRITIRWVLGWYEINGYFHREGRFLELTQRLESRVA